MQDLMIDLETMATEPNAVVLSIGACFFDIKSKSIGSKFYMTLETDEQLNLCRVVDESTVKWWESQSKEARRVFTEPKQSVRTVLDEFTMFILSNTNKSNLYVWGNGSSFDISIMESLYRDYNLTPPWMFWNVMDLRTFRRFSAGNQKVPKSIGTNHNALDDALNQVKFVLKYSK